MNARNALINYRRCAVGDLCSQGFADLYGGFIPIFWRPCFSELFTRWPRSSLLVRALASDSVRVAAGNPVESGTHVCSWSVVFGRVWQTKRDVKTHWKPQRGRPQSFPRRLFRSTRFNEIIFPVTRSMSLRAHRRSGRVYDRLCARDVANATTVGCQTCLTVNARRIQNECVFLIS